MTGPSMQQGEDTNRKKKKACVMWGPSFNKRSVMECQGKPAVEDSKNYPDFETVHPVLPTLWFQINSFPFKLQLATLTGSLSQLFLICQWHFCQNDTKYGSFKEKDHGVFRTLRCQKKKKKSKRTLCRDFLKKKILTHLKMQIPNNARAAVVSVLFSLYKHVCAYTPRALVPC